MYTSNETAVTFTYDALYRRIEKRYKKNLTKWVWYGNKPLHEGKEFHFKETTPNELNTWVFNEMILVWHKKNDKNYSFVNDHLGTPTQGYNESL